MEHGVNIKYKVKIRNIKGLILWENADLANFWICCFLHSEQMFQWTQLDEFLRLKGPNFTCKSTGFSIRNM